MGSNIELTASILWKLGQVKSEFAKKMFISITHFYIQLQAFLKHTARCVWSHPLVWRHWGDSGVGASSRQQQQQQQQQLRRQTQPLQQEASTMDNLPNIHNLTHNINISKFNLTLTLQLNYFDIKTYNKTQLTEGCVNHD